MSSAIIFVVGGLISVVAGILIYRDIQKQEALAKEAEKENNK